MGLFLISGLVFGTGAIQRQDHKPTISDGGGSKGRPVQNAASDVVLWNQPLSSVNMNAYVDQDFETAYDNYDSFLADDFTNTVFWVIKTIYIPGNLWNGGTDLACAKNLKFYIYSDNSGVPSGYPDGGLGGSGSPLWSLSLPPDDPRITLSPGTGGYPSDVTLHAEPFIPLPPGKYWLIFYPEMAFNPCGQYGRQPSDTTNGYTAKFINPGNGFGYGNTWMDWNVLGMSQTDIAFRLEGIEYLPIFHGSDFDGNSTSDIAVFRPSTGMWAIKDQYRIYFGVAGDIPVPGDYDGDGVSDVAVYRPSTGFWMVAFRSFFGAALSAPADKETLMLEPMLTVSVSGTSNIPVPGDYDGDGRTDIAVFNVLTGRWQVKSQFDIHFGTAGEIPVPADYNGDGKTDLAVVNMTTGHWRVRNQFHAYLGTTGDIPVPADYNGDGKAEVAIFRPSTGMWVISGLPRVFYGLPGDMPAPGDYNGDGIAEIAVFRPSTGRWYIRNIGNYGFGTAGDIPLVRGK